jgi:hypothetical protein
MSSSFSFIRQLFVKWALFFQKVVQGECSGISGRMSKLNLSDNFSYRLRNTKCKWNSLSSFSRTDGSKLPVMCTLLINIQPILKKEIFGTWTALIQAGPSTWNNENGISLPEFCVRVSYCHSEEFAIIIIIIINVTLVACLLQLQSIARSEVMPTLGTICESSFGRSGLTHTSGSLTVDFRLRWNDDWQGDTVEPHYTYEMLWGLTKNSVVRSRHSVASNHIITIIMIMLKIIGFLDFVHCPVF